MIKTLWANVVGPLLNVRPECVLRLSRRIQTLAADLAGLDNPLCVVVVTISDTSKGSKSGGDARCEIDRLRHEL